MSNILVFLQHASGKLPKASLVAIAAAKEIQSKWQQGSIFTLSCGPSAQTAAQASLAYGVEKAFHCEDASLEKYLAVPYAALMKKTAEDNGCDTLMASATSTGKDFFPRIAAELEAGQASDVIGIEADGVLVRPTFAGNVIARVKLETAKKLITVRVSAFAAAEAGQSSGSPQAVPVVQNAALGEVLSYETSANARPELSDAEIVVSGGRALQSAENFEKYIFPLADPLGAAVGASRAAVDSGYAPNDWQVGQTGKVVAPQLYVAVGISGAIQHLAGMKDSKKIVAINKDAEAPIFEVADYGLVADLYDALPKLTEAIRKAKAG